MRRRARAEGFMVGAAVASSAARRPVVVATPAVVPVPQCQTVIVEGGYNPYQPTAYQQPAYQQPTAYQQPAYQQPPYQQPPYQQPPYQQPAYQQPAYQQSGYPEPVTSAYGQPLPGYAPPPPQPIATPPAGYAPPPPTQMIVEAPPPTTVVVPAAAAAVTVAAAAAAAVETAAVIASTERRHFYLVNEATCTVLGVEKAALKAGTHAVIDRRRPDKAYHQIWYMDHDDIIRSKLTDFALESKGKDERVKLVAYVGDARQQWTLEGNRIVNKVVRTNCLGLRKLLRLKDDADVITQAYEGKPYQHWRIEPVVL